MAEIDDLKKENEQLKEKIASMEDNPEVHAFYALRKMLTQQTKRLNKFDLEKEISVNAKEDKMYERTMDIVVKMPKMISELTALKTELKITGNEEDDKRNKPFVDGIAKSRA